MRKEKVFELKNTKWTKKQAQNTIEIMGVNFKDLSIEQYEVLQTILTNG